MLDGRGYPIVYTNSPHAKHLWISRKSVIGMIHMRIVELTDGKPSPIKATFVECHFLIRIFETGPLDE
jgi:hypothetical protein